MADFYADMAKMATDLLAPTSDGGLGQGIVQLMRIRIGEKPNDWTDAPEFESLWTIRAAVKRLHQRYENGVLIIETGDQLIVSPTAVLTKLENDSVNPPQEVPFAPRNGDILVIDGVNRAIDNITPIPGAGTVSAWRVWSKA